MYDSNMGYCGKCKEAGDLLCCDTCPNAYHQKCIGITSIPDGDWFCNWYADGPVKILDFGCFARRCL